MSRLGARIGSPGGCFLGSSLGAFAGPAAERVLVMTDMRLRLIDATTGIDIWTYDFPSSVANRPSMEHSPLLYPAVVGQHLYVVYFAGYTSNDLLKLDLATGALLASAPVPVPGRGLNCVLIDGMIFCGGGLYDLDLNLIRAIDGSHPDIKRGPAHTLFFTDADRTNSQCRAYAGPQPSRGLHQRLGPGRWAIPRLEPVRRCPLRVEQSTSVVG